MIAKKTENRLMKGKANMNAQKKSRSVLLNFKVKPSEKKVFDDQCAIENMTPSSAMRQLMAAFVNASKRAHDAKDGTRLKKDPLTLRLVRQLELDAEPDRN